MKATRSPLRRNACTLAVSLALFTSFGAAWAEELTVLHIGDQESWLLSAQGNLRNDPAQAISFYGGVDRLASIIAARRAAAQAAGGTAIVLNAGDSFLPGPRLSASFTNLANAAPDGGQDFYDAIANRAIGAPINIWNDHSDSLSQRDCGWIQLFAETNQEALDLHIQAFRLAEELSLPVMVCMDGFILTHAYEQVDMPDQAQVDAFLPPYEPRQVLDPAEPVSIGAMVGPEAFMEVRYLAHAKQTMALERIPQIAAEFAETFGRHAGGLVRSYRTEDAETIVVALGSVVGSLEETVDAMRHRGVRIGLLSIRSFRPFPLAAVRAALGHAKRVVVLEKSFAVGLGGVVSSDVRMALSGIHLHGYTVVAGLGGRAITQTSLERMLGDAVHDKLEPLTFLDLDWDIVNRQLAREAAMRRSGPIAENLLRDVGAVAAKVS